MFSFLLGDGARWEFDPPETPEALVGAPLFAVFNSPVLTLLSFLGSFLYGFDKFDGIKGLGVSIVLFYMCAIAIDISIKQTHDINLF